MSDAEMDKTILNASITNAALELLPETIASMAIIPLQMRLVHRIGRSFGYEMDMSNAKDFVATLGVGLTGQYLEQFGRKLLGGLLGGLGGSLGRGVGRQAASSAMTFATTYAIGRVAQRYYAAGRTIDAATLKQTFAVDAGRGEGARAELPGPDRADVDEDRHAQPRVADQAGLTVAGRAQECVIACARSARSRCGTALNATIRVAVLPRTISVMPVFLVCRLRFIAACGPASSASATARPMTPPDVTTSTRASASRSSQAEAIPAAMRCPNCFQDSPPVNGWSCCDHASNASRTAVK